MRRWHIQFQPAHAGNLLTSWQCSELDKPVRFSPRAKSDTVWSIILTAIFCLEFLVLFSTFLRGHRRSIFFVFASFLVSIFVFAAIYQILYTRRRTHFNFNSNIQATQVREFTAEVGDRVYRLDSALGILREAMSTIQSVANNRNTTLHLHLPSGARFEITVIKGYKSPTTYQLNIYDSLGNEVITNEDIGKPISTEYVPTLISKFSYERLYLLKRAATLGTDQPDVWTFWDFVYFSTITQTTVGYGDILPNSTTIRMIVTIQISFGYTLLILVLNMLLS